MNANTFLSRNLEDCLLNKGTLNGSFSFFKMEILDKQTSLFASCLYLCSRKNFNLSSVSFCEPNTLVLVSDCDRDNTIDIADIGLEIKLLFFNCSFSTLFNELSPLAFFSSDIPSVFPNDKKIGIEKDFENLQFAKLFEDVMDKRLVTEVEIRNALNALPRKVEKYVGFGLVSFENAEFVPLSAVTMKFANLFPNHYIITYKNDILIMFSHNARIFDTAVYTENIMDDANSKIMSVLESYNGYVLFSHTTSKVESLRSVFFLTKRILNLSKVLRMDKTQRIFRQEDYSVYCTIDLAIQRYIQVENNEDVLYLAHPAIVLITRYDREHNTKLRDVLYYYLVNNNSLTKTAAELFMHKNTVTNKLNKIKSLIKLDFEDPSTKQRLIFSCQLLRYYEIVMKRTVY